MSDVFTFGEAMIRFSVPAGRHLETAPSFAVDVAGAELNVAVALARIGREVVWWSRLGGGPLARRIRDRLAVAGVDGSTVAVDESGRVGTYYVELHRPPRPTAVVYDRAGSAAAAMSPDMVPWDRVESARWVHVSGITPALSRSCLETTRAVVERARYVGIPVSFDVNYRAKLWSATAAAPILAEFVRAADLVLCTREDAETVFGISGRPGTVCDELARWSPSVVVTDGERGAWWRHDGDGGHVEALRVAVVDRLGAGDAFAAGVIDGMLDGDLAAGVRRGTVLAAVALTTEGDQVVVTRGEMEALVSGWGRRVDR